MAKKRTLVAAHATAGRAAVAGPGLLGQFAGGTRGNGESGNQFGHLMGPAIRTLNLLRISPHDGFKSRFAILALVFEDRHSIPIVL